MIAIDQLLSETPDDLEIIARAGCCFCGARADHACRDASGARCRPHRVLAKSIASQTFDLQEGRA